jgi:hypothetical protein|tara:strand:+ start:107 stop:688 length:582 start_codon:yes stop_codon:yes gene_type:complete
MKDIKDLNDFSVINIFNDEECVEIINSVDGNSDKLEVSDSYGGVEISAYEIPITKLDYDVFKLIRDKVSCLTSLTLAQSFIIKYNSDLLSYMPAHYDFTTVSVIINLNTNFNDGGTHFPLLKHTHKAQDYNNGDALVFKADKLSSIHEALSVTSGTRYVINLKFDEKRNFFNFVWNFIKLSLSFSYNKIKYKI